MTPEPAMRHVYRAYLLRLWEVDSDGQPVWRASLQDPRTGERLGFAGLAQLNEFLQQLTSDQHKPSPDPNPSE